LLDPDAIEKSDADNVDEWTFKGVPKDVTVPIDAGNVKVNLSPVSRVAGTAAPVDDKQSKALEDCPAEKTDGVIPKLTLLFELPERGRRRGKQQSSESR
jgi:hypothetical protein